MAATRSVHRWLGAGMLLAATACYSDQGLIDPSTLSYSQPPADAPDPAAPPVLTDNATTGGTTGGAPEGTTTGGTTGGGTAGTTTGGTTTGGTTGAAIRRQVGMAMQLERDATRCLDTAPVNNANVL